MGGDGLGHDGVMVGDEDAWQVWSRVGEPWRIAFELAFSAFKAGSVPVGAVIVTADERVVAHGRSRSQERTAPPGQVAHSHLAHAEINALLGLRPGDYWDHILYTTLEPCLLCTAALTHAHVGKVRYAWPDPLFDGIQQLPRLNAHVARRWAEREHALTGPLGAWGLVLPLVSYPRRDAEDPMDGYATGFPRLVELAQTIVDDRRLEPDDPGELIDVLQSLCGPLAAASDGD